MGDPLTQHSTLVQARSFEAPAARVFRAVSDPIERMRIYAAGAELTVAFEQLDLRVGGRDVFRFGRGNSLRFRGESIYHDIVPERRIVSSDIVSEGDVRLWVAATTLELTPMGPRTQLKLTAQVVWLDGADAVEGSDACYAALLAGLDRHLGGKPRLRSAQRA
jgi:uncharacterized protein YndB with AHSA1/START domain